MNRKTKNVVLGVNCALLCVALLAGQTSAEEGGSGHYLPGSMASFMDGVPAEPTVIARLNVISYDGAAGANRSIPIAGESAVNASVKSSALGLTLLWAPDWDFGDKWSYSMSTTIPMVSMEVSADIDHGNDRFRQGDKETALGDILLIPLMFNYQHSADFSTNYRLAIYAPTGSYSAGKLANTGKNFWTYEPTVALMYFGQKNGIEASLFMGVDFNMENSDTDYKSGTQAHLDGTLAQHFPLWSGLASAGITGFVYRQIKGDSGSGATFGDFKARSNGVGPVISWVSKVKDIELLAELKWLKEFDVKNRFEGDTIFLKIVGKF